jgi:mRNA-degrading endonuclease YafQ of YafQ-DinJ toxin-antitoxin module
MAQEIEIVLTEELKRAYQPLPDAIKKKFAKQLKFLTANPRHPSLKIHRLNGEWEFYVDIHYRCFFHREGNRFTHHWLASNS